MNVGKYNELTGKLWEIANRLRGPYRPPQYRLVMLPIIVLRRFDCVLEATRDKVLAEHERLVAAGTPEAAMEKLLAMAADPTREQPLYNVSPYTFQKLLDDQENIAPNLTAYINGFSENVRTIFERFKFSDQIEKLDAGNRLFAVVKAVADVDLHPSAVDNLHMGYLFEEMVRRFNEQANEEAGDHFTPREVIRLMAKLGIVSPVAKRSASELFAGKAILISKGNSLPKSRRQRGAFRTGRASTISGMTSPLKSASAADHSRTWCISICRVQKRGAMERKSVVVVALTQKHGRYSRRHALARLA